MQRIPDRSASSWLPFVLASTLALLAFLYLLLLLLGENVEAVREHVLVRADYLTTLLQIVPATVVAVFVFAAGAVFVVAQVIHSPLGSRGLEELLWSARVGWVLVPGVALLISSLLLVVAAPDIPEPELHRVLLGLLGTGEAGPREVLVGVAAAGTALAVATAFYVPVAIVLIVKVLADFVRPSAYTDSLAGPPPQPDPSPGGTNTAQEAEKARKPGPVAREDREATRRYREDLFRRVRALRQWLRISCASGESRDLTFALLGMHRLVCRYTDEIGPRSSGGTPPDRSTRGTDDARWRNAVRRCPPDEYGETQEIVRSHWNPDLRERDGDTAGSGPRTVTGWFGDEIGRAFTRSLDTGILRNGLLVRDADRLLGELRWSGTTFNDAGLVEEAGYIVDRITEVGLFARLTADSYYQDWCGRAAARILLDLATEFKEREALDPPAHGASERDDAQAEHLLSDRALAGWTLLRHELPPRTEIPDRVPTDGGLRVSVSSRWAPWGGRLLIGVAPGATGSATAPADRTSDVTARRGAGYWEEQLRQGEAGAVLEKKYPRAEERQERVTAIAALIPGLPTRIAWFETSAFVRSGGPG